MQITCVTVDCSDPAALASFWNEAQGWGGVAAHPGGGGAVCRPANGGTELEKNRLHLGCSAMSLTEQDTEITRLIELGASIAWEDDFPPGIAAT